MLMRMICKCVCVTNMSHSINTFISVTYVLIVVTIGLDLIYCFLTGKPFHGYMMIASHLFPPES